MTAAEAGAACRSAFESCSSAPLRLGSHPPDATSLPTDHTAGAHAPPRLPAPHRLSAAGDSVGVALAAIWGWGAGRPNDSCERNAGENDRIGELEEENDRLRDRLATFEKCVSEPADTDCATGPSEH